jgi:uncharacterized coiled-coil DUF342 family protein
MNFTNRPLFFLAVVLALFAKFSIASAQSIPGYIGQMSFRISDDRDLSEMNRRVEDSRRDLDRMMDSRNQLNDQANTLARELQSMKQDFEQLNAQVENSKNSMKQLQDRLNTLNQNAEQNKDEIAKVQSQINDLKSQIDQSSQRLGSLKLQIGPVSTRLDQVNHDLQDLNRRCDDSKTRLSDLIRQKENFERQLIADIARINQEGANRGTNDGAGDGRELSDRLANDSGSRDGTNDGFNQGTIDGENRDYSRGADQGEKDGSAKARLDGTRDGTRLGTQDGNISAATREATLAGNKRADASDAANVGIAQGKVAGLDHAKSEGRTRGEDKGETETVNKYESTPLSSSELNGQFAGSFARRSPSYPGDFNGRNFNPNVSASREVLVKAYSDGYISRYRDYSRDAFNRSIDASYNRVYDQYYNSNYQTALNKDYPESYNQGHRDAETRAYNRDYPIIKGQYYDQFFAQYDQNPNRTSNDFKSTYASVEPKAYAYHYEEIRKANFDRVELDTFNANILEQTEIFRKQRISEVTKIYNENAILMFDSSEMLDGGISGVAKLDGVFQAGELTLHNIVLKNFGFKEAKSVRVKVDGGKEFIVPSIPARSIVKIKGAAMSALSDKSALGSVQKISLSVLSTLTSEDAVEAIHFDRIKDGVLKLSEVKTAKIGFPFSLSNLHFDSLLLKDNVNKLKVTIANNSKRAFTGELKIELLTNSSNNLIKKDFQTLGSLNNSTSTELSDAEILVGSDEDIYRDLSFSAKISQNGVVIGLLNADYITMAKSAYIEKANAPVIITDSTKSMEDFLDILADLGGSTKVSILDMSLTNLNASVLSSGLKGKGVIVLDTKDSAIVSNLNTLISKSTSAFMLINEGNTGLSKVQSLSSFKDNQKLVLDTLPNRQFVFTNPYRADGLVGMSVFFNSTKENLLNELKILQTFGTSKESLINQIKTDLTRANYSTPNTTQKILGLRTMAEVMNINFAYDKSGNIFNRDKKWADMIENDGSLLLNQVKAASNGQVTEAKVSSVLSAVALKDFVSQAMSNYYDIKKNMMPKILNSTNRVLGNIEDGFKKSLKDFDKGLYNTAYDKASLHRPFFIEQPQPN